jgi:S-formylglutathione hydrolase FrmB
MFLVCFAGVEARAQWVTPPVHAERVEYRLFESQTAGAVVSYHIYTPPQYDRYPERCFPVLVWLHGSGGQVASIEPISRWFHNAIVAGRFPPMIVVMPNGMSFSMWCDSKDGRVPMETMVIEDLLADVRATDRVVPHREGWLIEGFSMGGQGAARLGLRRPDLFAGVSILGAGPLQLDFLDAPKDSSISPKLRLQIYEAVWGSDPAYYMEQHPRTVASNHAAEVIASGQRIRQAVGDQDFVLQMNQEFHAHLTDLAIPHAFSVLPGIGHNTLGVFLGLGPANAAFYRGLFDRYDPAGVDLNDDALINFFDLAIYGDRFIAGDPAADLNADGIINFFDLAEYLSRYRGSCG